MDITFSRVAIAYAASLVAFLLMDIGWITLVVSPMYKSELGTIVLDKPSMPPAIAFYLLYLAGLVFFAVVPALRGPSVSVALLHGALYGFFAYVTYSLTNLSVLRGWSGLVAASDIGWGVVVSAVAAAASFYVTRWVVGLGQ